MGFCTFILHTTSFGGNILLFYHLNPELRAGCFFALLCLKGFLDFSYLSISLDTLSLLALVINGEYGYYLCSVCVHAIFDYLFCMVSSI